MCEVEALSKLNDHIVDGLDVRPRHINRKVQVLSLDVAEDVASIVVFGHREVSTAVVVSKTVEGRYNIRMSLQVDPLCYVLIVGDLTDDELLSEVLVVHDVGRITDHMFNLRFQMQTLSKN